MSVIFSDHLDGTNGATLVALTNTNFGQVPVSSSTLQFDTSQQAAGTSSAKCAQTASFGTASMISPAYVTTATMYTRFCLRLSAIPNGNLYIAQVVNSALAIVGRLAINSTGKLAVYNATTLTSTGTVTLSANTWYRVEWDIVGTTATARIYAGPTSATLVDTVTATITGSTFQATHLGIVASANSTTQSVWIDEVVLDNASTPGPVGGPTASSTGALGFSGSATSSLAASSHGSLAFGGSAYSLTPGGKIAGFSDSFAGTSVDPSKWIAKFGATQNYGAVCPAVSGVSSFTSAQYWDATASTCFVGISPMAAGTGDLTVSLVKSTDPTKYLQVKVSGGNLVCTILDGGADSGVVTRAVTSRDNVVRITETGGSITVEMRERNSAVWSTLRTMTTPAWFNTVLVVLGGYSGSASTAKAVFSTFNNTLAQPSGHLLSSTLSDDYNGTSLAATRWTAAGPGAITVNNDVEVAAVNTGDTQVTSVDIFSLDVASLLIRPAVVSSADVTSFKLLGPILNTEARFTLTAGQLFAEYRVAGVLDAYTVSVTRDNTTPVYCRFTADLPNNNLVWDYSIDGINFAPLRTSPLPSWYTGVQFAYAAKAA